MFKLAGKRASERGIYCGTDGLYVGAAALIVSDDRGNYRIRQRAEIEALLRAAYDTLPEIEPIIAGFQRVANHLRSGNLPLAMIAAVQLNLPEIAEERIERLARTAGLLKANFDPNQPRDERGRWADRDEASDRGGGDGNEGTAGSGSGHEVPTSAGAGGAAMSQAWKNHPNADFRNRLAVAEQTPGPKNSGYSEVHNSSDPTKIALGRYQLTPAALRAAGMIDRAGNWTGKYRIHSQAAFLSDPDAQEKALTDYLNDNERQLQANGAYSYIGRTIDGLKARFPVTRAGLMAAAHRDARRRRGHTRAA